MLFLRAIGEDVVAALLSVMVVRMISGYVCKGEMIQPSCIT